MDCQPIGLMRSPFKDLADMPVQPRGADGVIGRIELHDELVEGLKDLDGFSHLVVLYHFHHQAGVLLSVTPFLDNCVRGLFATRAPCRPNAIGLSVLRLRRISGSVLEVEDIDVVDGTPVIDIKPYVPCFDRPRGEVRTGWLEFSATEAVSVRSDGRFTDIA